MINLQQISEQLIGTSVDGIPGVIHIDSGKEGPELGITACTHGNEPTGLAVFGYLLKELNLQEKLLRGSVYLVVNNLEATQKFFEAKTEKQKSEARYVEVNMNRLPEDFAQDESSTKSEVVRAQELLPIWKRFTHALDIHSTHVPTQPMLISRKHNFESIQKLIVGFPIEVLVTNIDVQQIGTPAFASYGESQNTPVFAIEAGQHTSTEAFECAQVCVTNLLQNLDMITGETKQTNTKLEEYEVCDSVMFPTIDFDFVTNFHSYDVVTTGQVLAQDANGKQITSPLDGHLLLPTQKRGHEKDISEEVAFLTKPVKVRAVIPNVN